jgi:regulator of sigma E protease
MTTLLSFIVAIAILVYVHEMGHYSAARFFGVQVERFSIGFGKPLFKWHNKRSGTEWVVAAIPLGGYVRMKESSFEEKSLPKRAWIVFAGPLANLIFASIAYAVLFASGRDEPQAVLAQPPAQSAAALAGIQAGDEITSVEGRPVRSFTDMRWRMAQAVVGEGAQTISLQLQRAGGGVYDVALSLAPPVPLAGQVSTSDPTDPVAVIRALGLSPQSRSVNVIRVQEGSAAAQAGLRAGDQIIDIEGQPVQVPDTVIKGVQASGGKPLALIVKDSQGRQERVVVNPRAGADGVFRMGAVVGADIATVHVADDPLTAVVSGVRRTWEMTQLTFQALGRMVMGELSWKQISGPVTIAETAGQSADNGLQAFIGFLALISISIAVLNLLPIPMLDGGHLLYYLWEVVRGKPLPAQVQDAGRRIGLALIMLLTVVALFNDFARLLSL